MLSIVIPVYKNEENLPRLFQALEELAPGIVGGFEVVFVVDGSPDRSLAVLRHHLPSWSVRSQLVELSRNFGSFSAITAGLRHGRGEYFAVIAADLQEPPELAKTFLKLMQSGAADVVFGHRTGRTDPWMSRFLAESFWSLYRRLVIHDMPKGGIDVFGCTRQVRDHLLQMKEVHTNLIALLLWLGFRRAYVPYERRERLEGVSAWRFGRKVRYALDSVFSFTDLPIRLLLILGGVGTLAAFIADVTVLISWALGKVPVLGYTPLMLTVASFGALTALGLGINGQYLWLSLQNARGRPNYIVRSNQAFHNEALVDERAVSAPRVTEIRRSP